MLHKSLDCVQEKTPLLKLTFHSFCGTCWFLHHTHQILAASRFLSRCTGNFCSPHTNDVLNKSLCACCTICLCLTDLLLFVHVYACLWACSCMYIHIHVEARERPQVSSLRSCSPPFWRSSLTGLELTDSSKPVGLQTPCSGLSLTPRPPLPPQRHICAP